MPPRAKKARTEDKGDKDFEEYTVAELRELYDEQGDNEDNVNYEQAAERAKQAIVKQFTYQMVHEKDLSENQTQNLRKDGRELVAFIPNVEAPMLTALGLDKVDDKGQIKDQRTEKFMPNGALSKSAGGGAVLIQLKHVSFKYVKTSRELRITGAYKFKNKPKPKPKARRARRGAGAPEAKEADGADGGEDEEDDDEEDEENDEEATDAAPGGGAGARAAADAENDDHTPAPAPAAVSASPPAKTVTASPAAAAAARPSPSPAGAASSDVD